MMGATLHTAPQSLITRGRQLEVGAQLGALVFLGDVQGNMGVGGPFIKDVNPANTTAMRGVFLTWYPDYTRSPWGFKLALSQGVVHGADSLIAPGNGAEQYRKKRNLSFRTTLWEGYFQTQLEVGRSYRLHPFLAAGIGVVYFTPRTLYQGAWVELRPLHTENVIYPQVVFLFPFSAGLLYTPGERSILSLEVNHRITTTDYLDDVSTFYPDPSTMSGIRKALSFRENSPRQDYGSEQRGDPMDRDSYFSITLKYSVLLTQNVRFLRRQSMKCPKLY